MSVPATPTRRPGRRTIVAGGTLLVAAVVAIGGAVLAWQVWGGPSSDGAVAFEMPGSTTADLTAGDWALYSEEVDGTQHVAYPRDISVTGPGDVGVESAIGFYEDTTSVELDGTTYQVFARLDVPTDGSYDVTVRSASERTTAVIGHYETDDTLGWVVVLTVVGAILLMLAGVVTLGTGLVLRARGRQAASPPPPAA